MVRAHVSRVLAVCAALTAMWGNVGCGDDASESFDDTGFGDGDGDGDGIGDGDGDGDGDGTAGDGDGDGSAGDGDFDPSCGELDCGPGDCVEVGGVGFCDCPEGSVVSNDGQGCLACDEADGGFNVNVRSFQVSGRITVGLQPPPASPFDAGDIVFENPGSGDRIVVASTSDQDYEVQLVPGVYDIYYELRNGGAEVPRNEHAQIGTIAVFEELSADIDVPVVEVGGPILVDGVVGVGSGFDRGAVYLVDETTGDRVFLGNTEQGLFDLSVVPGTYKLYYGLQVGGVEVPRNSWAPINGVELEVDTPSSLTMVDVPTVSLSGSVSINGSSPPASQFDLGLLVLQSPDAVDRVVLGNTAQQSYEALVLPGDYVGVYELLEGGVQVPVNEHAVVAPAVVVPEAGEVVVNLEIEAYPLSGGISLNGGAPPASEFDDGLVWLVGETGDRAVLGKTGSGSLSALVIAGDYDVHYGVETPGPTIPANADALVGSLQVSGPQDDLSVDLQAAPISGAIQVNAQEPPQSLYQNGRLLLRDKDTGTAFPIGNTHQGGYSTNVLLGTYDLFYAEDSHGPGVPDNRRVRLEEYEVGGTTTSDVNIPMREVSGSVTINGAAPPTGGGDSAQLFLRNSADADSVYVGATAQQSYELELVPGVYNVVYLEDETQSLPANTNGRVSCFVVE